MVVILDRLTGQAKPMFQMNNTFPFLATVNGKLRRHKMGLTL